MTHALEDNPTGSPVRATLGTLCAGAVRDVGADGGGVTVLSSRGVRVVLHASDALATLVEELQFTLGEGPGIDATALGHPVVVADTRQPPHGQGQPMRWTALLGEARRAGALALFAFPIKVGALSVGSLGLYRRTPGPLDGEQFDRGLAAGRDLADCLLDPGLAGDGSATYPMTVHQAVGMVMVQIGSTIEEAMLRLRATSFADGIPIHTLASEVIGGHRRFSKEDR